MSTKPLGRCGRAVEARDGMLHVEGPDGQTMCGQEIAAYPLHWDTTTVVACGSCLIAAGVPLKRTASGATGEPLPHDRRRPAMGS